MNSSSPRAPQEISTPKQTPRKATLRRAARRLRDHLSEQERTAAGQAIARHVLALLPKLPACVDDLGRPNRGIGLYSPIGSEADTRPLMAQLTRRCLPFALPRVVGEEPNLSLIFSMVDSRTPLEMSTWGILEPALQHAQEASCCMRLQALFVPCLAFDSAGHRLGYGRGLYDRTLQSYPGTIIGLAYSQQQVTDVPAEAHDVPLHGVMTEEGFICAPDSPLQGI
jgi:5-formyltetrahydrofolate cyclo-ligase